MVKQKLSKKKLALTILLFSILAGLVIGSFYILKPGRVVEGFKRECSRQQKPVDQESFRIDEYSLDVCKNILRKTSE
jgi:hypothetical protein